MTTKAEYLVLQHVSNPIRMEGRNVGVIVRKGDDVVARFYGENGETIDGRKLRGFSSPDVYRQWIQYWRRCLSTTPDPFKAILDTQRSSYRAFVGGEVLDTDTDPAADVANYLYSVLVSEGGFAEALALPEGEEEMMGEPFLRLDRELTDAFRKQNILQEGSGELPLVKYPVRHRQHVQGTVSEPHQPEFSQLNGRLVVMESVDFSVKAKEPAKDHAGLAAAMFRDLRDSRRDRVEAIAIVRASAEDESSPAVRYGLSLLRKNANRLVDWTREAEAFVEERRAFAMGAK